MGKVANAKRKLLFQELEKNGILKPPKKPVKRVVKPKPEKFVCCTETWGDKIPSYFKRCQDCPLTKDADSDTVSVP